MAKPFEMKAYLRQREIEEKRKTEQSQGDRRGLKVS